MNILDTLWQKHAACLPDLLAARPSFRFDPNHYRQLLGGVAMTPNDMLAHYNAHGRAEGREPTLYREALLRNPGIADVVADLVIDRDLADAIAAGDPDATELAFELIHLGTPIDADVSDFSMSGYLDMHPDIKAAKLDPFLHYLGYGHAEGRKILRDIRAGQYAGRLPYRPELPTVLIAIHECSRTGAPIVGRDLAREAAKTHNVVVSALRDGPLLEDLRATSCQVLITNAPFQDLPAYTDPVIKKIDFAILNSAVSRDYIPLMVAREIPFAGYLHEYAEYTHPASHFYLFPMLADLLVFSSEHVRNSWKGRMSDVNFDTERDSTIIPQRPLFLGHVSAQRQAKARANLSRLVGRDLSKARLVCGAGLSQWRKGTDIFAMAAQICQSRDPNTVFLWIGHGIVPDELGFGAYMAHHLKEIGMGQDGSNLFFLPAGPDYSDVMAASDAMFLSSRLDPLPNVVFDALEHGCHIVQFDGASGFGDDIYRQSGQFSTVQFGNPDAAASAILSLPPKATDAEAADKPAFTVFEMIRKALYDRLEAQTYFVRGTSEIDTPIMFSDAPKGSILRALEREKMERYKRRLVWRDLDDVRRELAGSDNWVHKNMRLTLFETTQEATLPDFAIHVHAYYIDELDDVLSEHCLFQHARRIVLTTDTEKKGDQIREIMGKHGLVPEIELVSNTGRDILPFMQMFMDDGVAGSDEIWCHLHLKKSLSTTKSGDVWRRFLMRILLGNETKISDAISTIADDEVGLVAPFDPYFIGWNESRHILPKFAHRLPGPMPKNPLLFPIGNMFWVRRSVVMAMNDIFGADYPWPSEPIANDGTEYHLIERLWPAMATHLGLESVFIHKLDEQRV
jgi:glycosyltransferase involved in cell wall biosynthesis